MGRTAVPRVCGHGISSNMGMCPRRPHKRRLRPALAGRAMRLRGNRMGAGRYAGNDSNHCLAPRNQEVFAWKRNRLERGILLNCHERNKHNNTTACLPSKVICHHPEKPPRQIPKGPGLCPSPQVESFAFLLDSAGIRPPGIRAVERLPLASPWDLLLR